LIADAVPGISAKPHEDNLRYFDVDITGPEQSPFEGSVLFVEIEIEPFINKILYSSTKVGVCSIASSINLRAFTVSRLLS
jgi:hypothetical protein